MMFKDKTNRRNFLTRVGAGAVALGSTGWLLPAVQQGRMPQIQRMPQIRMSRNYRIGRYHYDPLGLFVEAGQTVSFFSVRAGFSATAYHPDNDNHELRIPEQAEPFDSGILWNGETFDWKFEVEGTYDVYSRNQEMIGAVGRIVVGRPGGPGEKPPGYGSREGWAPMYKEVIRTLELAKSEDIVREKMIPYPAEALRRRYPQY
jgi:plastocyanin